MCSEPVSVNIGGMINEKKFSVCLLILYFAFLAGCSTVEDRKIKILLENEDREILNLSVDLQQKLAASIWPGFEKFRTSAVYITTDGQFLFNAKGEPPTEYKKIESQRVNWRKQDYRAYDWYGPSGGIVEPEEFEQGSVASAYSSDQTDRHFPFSILFIDSLERFHFKEMKLTIDDWIAIFWHESFHNFQDELYAQKLVTASPQWKKTAFQTEGFLFKKVSDWCKRS